jgi:hypothetical protein
MKKVTALLLILFSVTCHLSPPTSLAHFVKSDAGIGAILHVDPGDDPVAGERSNIILEFKDTNNIFNLDNCVCKINVSRGNEEILSQNIGPVAPHQQLSSVTPITFPAKDIYILKITGSSKDNSYEDFELNYDIRVAKDDLQSTSGVENKNWLSGHIIHFAGFLILAFLVFALVKHSFARS